MMYTSELSETQQRRIRRVAEGAKRGFEKALREYEYTLSQGALWDMNKNLRILKQVIPSYACNHSFVETGSWSKDLKCTSCKVYVPPR